MDIKEKLSNHLDDFNVAPFLFVGSGFSRRYLGLEDWEGLLRRFAKMTNNPYHYYSSDNVEEESKPEIASSIAEDFYDIWWDNKKYEDDRNKFEDKIKNKHSPLKLKISEYIKNKKLIYNDPNFKMEEYDWLKKEDDLDFLREELNQLKEANINGIITTNWDTLLKDLFPSFKRFIGQEELLLSNPREIAEIYKIHGCSTSINSLILTAEDYDKFDEKNPYLAAKLLTIFVEHPIIFLGYSMRDPNIVKLLNSLTSCLTERKEEKLKNNLIFVKWEKDLNKLSMEDTYFPTEDIPLPITIIRTKYFTPIYKALGEFERKFSPRVVRKLRTQVYNMVKTTEPESSVEVIDIDDETNFDEVDIICGVGIEAAKKGLKGISSADIFEDIIFNNLEDKGYRMQGIVEDALPRILTTWHYTPFYKYLRKANFLKENSFKLKSESKENLSSKIIKRCTKYNSYDDFLNRSLRYKKQDVKREFRTIEEIKEKYEDSFGKCLQYIPALGEERINIKELEGFLKKFYDKYPSLLEDKNAEGERRTYRTNFRRLIRIYDWLKYGRA